jgi:hypothetical protein
VNSSDPPAGVPEIAIALVSRIFTPDYHNSSLSASLFLSLRISLRSFTMSEKKNEVVMLEQQITREESILKPVPIVGKVDYSGAYEVFPPHS